MNRDLIQTQDGPDEKGNNKDVLIKNYQKDDKKLLDLY